MHDIAIAASSFEQGFKDTFSMLLDSRNDHWENTAIQNKLKECGDVLATGPPKKWLTGRVSGGQMLPVFVPESHSVKGSGPGNEVDHQVQGLQGVVGNLRS